MLVSMRGSVGLFLTPCLLLFLAGCVESAAVPCGTGFCSTFTVCGPQDQCVLPSQLDACIGKSDGDGCSYPTVDEGVCATTVCVPAGCGNGVVESDAGEACDDGNRISFDGCSADCTSSERCGDGIVDRALGEDCDCGDGGVAVEGCTQSNADVPGATCRSDCLLARCGDEIVDPAEACDDGNNLPGDGCRADCVGRWTAMNSGTFLDLYDVWGTSGTDVYAVGDRRLLHFDGLAWSTVALPPSMASTTLYRVGGTGPSDLHVAAVNNKLFHYDGTSWSEFETPVGAATLALWILSTSSGWVAVTSSAGQLLYEWDGSTWNLRTTPVGMGLVYDMWGVGADIYAGTSDQYLWKLVGSTWEQVLDGDSNPLRGELVHGSSASDVHVLGTIGETTHWHYDGVAWTAVTCCDDLGSFLTAFGGSAGDYVLFAEANAMVFDGSSWKSEPTYTSFRSRAIWGYAPGHAFVVGDDGTILY